MRKNLYIDIKNLESYERSRFQSGSIQCNVGYLQTWNSLVQLIKEVKNTSYQRRSLLSCSLWRPLSFHRASAAAKVASTTPARGSSTVSTMRPVSARTLPKLLWEPKSQVYRNKSKQVEALPMTSHFVASAQNFKSLSSGDASTSSNQTSPSRAWDRRRAACRSRGAGVARHPATATPCSRRPPWAAARLWSEF